MFCGFFCADLAVNLGRWPVSISNSWNGSKLFMGEECAELVRFREQWIEYVLLYFRHCVSHILYYNHLNFLLVDVLAMKLIRVKSVAN